MKNINIWIERAFEFANDNSDDDDIIYKAIYKYKALRELSNGEIEDIYDYISERMGYK